MARFQPSYGYAFQSRRRAPRWPWVFALLIVAALVAAGAVLVAGGGLSVDNLDPREPAREAAVVATDTPEQPPTTEDGERGENQPAPILLTPRLPGSAEDDEPEATNQPDATTLPTVPVATEPTPAGEAHDGAEVAAVGAQADPAQASPAAEEPGAAPMAVVETYIASWEAGDYEALYDLLSSDAQDSIDRQAFVDRYVAIAERAGLTEIRVEITGEPNLQTEIPLKVTMQSSRVGEIVEENVIKLVKEDGAWKVAWTPSLIFRDLGSDGCIEYTESGGKRGAILDRNGEPLALDGPIRQIGIVPGELTAEPGNETRVLRELSQLLGMSTDEIRAKYETAGDPDWFMPVKDVSVQEGDRLLNDIAGLQGVRILPATARVYPYGALTAHITGYLSRVTADDIERDPSLAGVEWVARAGIEAGADEILSGTPDARLSVVQCDTRAERSLIKEQKGKPAKDVVLTIDVDFQYAVDKALADVDGQERGSAVIIDPRTGAVLALVSHPTFDPNLFILGMTTKDAERLNDDDLKPLLNRATMASYPTGSIFKAITTAAALTHLGMTPETLIDCPAQYTIPGTNVIANDWVVAEGVPAQGTLTLHQALVQSCNTVFYQIGYELDNEDPDLLPDMAKAFGLGAPTGIPYLPETGGVVPSPEWKLETVGDYWATGDAINLAIGQGYLLATPLQMANVYATIANGGDLLQPFIVEYTQDAAGQLERIGERTVIREVPVSRQDIAAIQAALRDQTSNSAGVGSARVFGDFPWPIAGKTGTAQTDVTQTSKPHSWFAAFGPYGEEATIASAVMVEVQGEGVSFSAPATRKIYEYYLKTDLAAETGG